MGDEVQEEELDVGKLRKSAHYDIDQGPRVPDVIVLVQNSHDQCMVERIYGLLDDSGNGLEMVWKWSQIFDDLQVRLAWLILG